MNPPINSVKTEQLLERLASLMRSKTRVSLIAHGLLPVQFEALHYLSRCNRYSDSPMAVVEYLGQTKGTVSQTLKILEKKGLLQKSTDTADKRVKHLIITAQGRALVGQILPSPLLEMAAGLMGDNQLSTVNAVLTELLRTLQRANQSKTFGQCGTCQHNITEPTGGHTCGLTKESLTVIDVSLICLEHEHKK